jgi:hypothetical protein
VTVPVRTPLATPTTNRKWYLDVNTTPSAAATWVPVMGMTEFQFGVEATTQDASDFDSEGFRSTVKTAEAWSVTCTVVRKVLASSSTAYDVGQEFLRSKSFGNMGVANQVSIRFYEMEEDGPREEAYAGLASVGWSPNGGGMDAISSVAVTLSGQGQLNEIAHPDAA